MRIMTCNIWGDYFGNPVEERQASFAKLFLDKLPDVIGIQEYTSSWYKSKLFSDVADVYQPITVGENNYTPLLYQAVKFRVLTSGWELYHQTPDNSKSVTWAVLEEMKTGKRIGACNTHFWWKQRPEDIPVRVMNAEQLSVIVRRLAAEYRVPVFAFGDLNCTFHTEEFQTLLKNGFVPLVETAQSADRVSSWHGDPVRDAQGVYCGTRTENDKHCSLDHILAFGYDGTPLQYRVVEEQYILDASDHSPVYVDVTL